MYPSLGEFLITSFIAGTFAGALVFLIGWLVT